MQRLTASGDLEILLSVSRAPHTDSARQATIAAHCGRCSHPPRHSHHGNATDYHSKCIVVPPIRKDLVFTLSLPMQNLLLGLLGLPPEVRRFQGRPLFGLPLRQHCRVYVNTPTQCVLTQQPSKAAPSPFLLTLRLENAVGGPDESRCGNHLPPPRAPHRATATSGMQHIVIVCRQGRSVAQFTYPAEPLQTP